VVERYDRASLHADDVLLDRPAAVMLLTGPEHGGQVTLLSSRLCVLSLRWGPSFPRGARSSAWWTGCSRE